MPKTNRHDIDPSWCLHIHMWMMTELGLSGAERDVYAAVYGFTFEGGWKQIEWSFLAAFTGCSMATVRRAADALIKRGLLEKSAIVTKFGPRNQFRAIRPRPVENHVENPVENEARESAPARNEHAPLPKTSTPPARNEHAHVNRHINCYKNEDIRAAYRLEKWPEEPAEGWDEVEDGPAWAYFRQMYPKPVPRALMAEARAKFCDYVRQHGFRRVVEQLDAYLEASYGEGTKLKYLKNAGAWVLDGYMKKDYATYESLYAYHARMRAREDAERKARAAHRAPEAIECPVCGARAERGSFGLYHCAACDADIKPSWA